jgi:hypothetical protein
MARATITSRRAATGVPRRALLWCAALLLVAIAPPQPAIAMPADAVAGASQACSIVGNSSGNTLAGSARDDVVCGHDGGDRLQGKAGSDRLEGGQGNDNLFGGAGADDLDGGSGNDGLGGGLGPDELSGGPGRDIAYYGQRAQALRVSLGDRRPDGSAREGDHVHADVEDVQGGRGNDVVIGNGRSNRLFGRGGRDQLRGRGGNDVLIGGGGSDRIDARDGAGSADRIECGGGEDTALVDPADSVDPDCEHVVGAAPSPPQNNAPTGIVLSNASVAENQPAGTAVGTLSAGDPDPGDTHAFALVPGAGSADNGSFQIVGSTLRTAAAFDYEAKSSYSIRVRATDFGTPAGQIVREFTIAVTDTSEPPIADAKTTTVDEDATRTITLSATDPEGDDPLTFAAASPGNGSLSAPTNVTCNHGTPNVCTAEVDYTPTANFNGADSFTYTAGDGANDSLPATVTIAVFPFNDVPLASSGSRTAGEDTALPLDLGSLVSDVETSDANLMYTVITQPAHGTVTGTTYTPDPDYNGTDSLTYEVTDRGDPDNCSNAPCDTAQSSTTETVSIDVAPINDPPVAASQSLSVDEDGSLPIDLAGLVSDIETADANLTYAIDTPPAHGGLSGSGASRTYTPAANFNGADSITYRITDRGDPDNCSTAPCDPPEAATGTISITVDAVNDAPVNTLPAGPVTALQNTDTPIAGVSIADVDAGGDAVRLTLSVVTGTVTVNTSVPLGVGPLDVLSNGTASVTVTATLAQINTTLAANGLVYRSAVTGADTLTATTDDLGHNGSGGPKTDTDTLALIVNTPPVAAGQAVTTNEDVAKTITLSASDADGDDPLTFAIGAAPTHGTLGAIGAVTCNHSTPNVCTADVVYTPAADFNEADSFTFTASDEVNASAPATVSITVDAVNDVPKLENIEPGALAYTENDPATLVTGSTTVSDVDSVNFDTGTLTVDYATGGTADDRLEIQNVGQIAVSGANVTHGGTTIGSFTGGTGTTPLVVTLNANATAPITEALVRAVAYRNVSDAPSTAVRTARFVLTDGDGGISAPATRAIALTAVNDVPVLAAIEPGALGYTEDDAATPVTSSLTVTDPDGNITGAAITIAGNLAPAEDVLSFTNQLGISGTYSAGTGVLTLTGSASPADYQTALRAVRYSNTSQNPSTLTRTVSFQVQDGPAAANLSNVESRDVTVTAVNDVPVADDETFNGNDSAHGNTAMIVNDPDDGAPNPTYPKTTVTGDILAGDTDVDGPGPLTVTPGTVATNDGGSVTIESDGDFTFLPAASTSCTDTSDFFDYTVEDSGSPELTDTGRVTIQIAGCVWYVSNSAAGNAGTSSAPFDTLAQAEAASGVNHTVFVFDGDNTSNGYGGDGYAMNAGERLIGEHEGLVVDPDQGGSLTADTLHPANPGAHPTLTATNADVISLDDGNEVRGFNLDPEGTGGGIAGGAGDTGGGTIDDVNIVDGGTAGTQAGLELDGTTGTFNITNLVVNNKATGVLLNNAGTTDFGSTTITSDGGPGLSATGTNMSTSEFAAITVSNSGNGGVNLDGTTGTTLLGDGAGIDLSLTTTSGTQPAFRLSNAGSVTVGAAGTDNVSATGGAAVDVTGTSGITLDFDDVDSTNSSGDGINLAGLGTGTFSAASGTIAGAAGIAFDLDGGSGTVSYPGALNDGTGQAAEITGRTGGAVTLGGAIADGADAGGGINLSGNTGGSTTFSNASKVLNTTTASAVSFTGSDGHTLTLSGGGLDIDTTSGAGFNATNSGTLTVSGAGNTIASTTGTALNVSNTDFGGATFQSISANGAANGINLNTTGSTAGLTVTGSGNASQGGDNSGGTIQNTTGHGIALANTSSPSFTNVRLLNTGDSGVNGTQVSGFSFANGTITGAGDASDENSITFDDSLTNANLTGAVTITNNVISQTEAEGIDIHNFAGTISNADISNNALSDTGDVATPGSAISLLAGGQPSAAASITRAAISNNTITDFRAGVGVQVRGGNVNAGGPPGNAGIAGSATDIIAVTGNLMNGGSGGVGNQPDRFFTGGAAGIGQGNFDVSNNGTAGNRIRNIDCIAIELQADGPVNVTTTVQNNFINANSAVGCAGIAVGTDDPSALGAGTHSTLISGNDVMGTDGPGIFPIVRDSGSTMTARVLNNTVAAPITTNAARAGIRVDSGSATGDTTLCLEISGNTTAGSTNTGTATTSPGINLRKQGTDPAVNAFGIEGMAATSSPGVENYVNGLNTSTSGTFGVGGTALLSAASGFTNCNAP